jgi:transcriptional regulator with XRE-family HTH domain
VRNQLLRTARERTPSRQVPGEWLSRREVAEAVNMWIYENTKKTTTLDANYLAKLERGVVRWPSARYRAGLRAVLGVTTDAELGFYPPRRSGTTTRADVPLPQPADPEPMDTAAHLDNIASLS